MIARIWRAEVDEERAQDYERFARERSRPMFRHQPGCLGVVMVRDGRNCAVLSLWQDRAAVDALASSLTYQQTVRDLLALEVLVGPQSVEVLPVHLLDLKSWGFRRARRLSSTR